jgi:pimeloyl-ACP methyl ester carboxylesterase
MSVPNPPLNSPAVTQKRKRRLKPILKWIAILAILLVVFAALAGAAYQAFYNARDARRFPWQGHSFPLGPEFGQTSLALYCTGQGSPTVLLDSGLGVPGIAGWKFVQPEVVKFTRVCSYDRAGYGWSSPGPMPRTSEQIVKELHALLAASGEKGPYLFVAHSFGGYNVRIYTSHYSADVAGLVLVDTSHEDQAKYMPPTLKEMWKKQSESIATQQKLFPYLLFFGIARFSDSVDEKSKLPRDFQEEIRYLRLNPQFVYAHQLRTP